MSPTASTIRRSSETADGAKVGGTPHPESLDAIPSAGSSSQPGESRMNRIARRAHEIYEARGGEHGKAMEDWLKAERQIDAEIDEARGGVEEHRHDSPPDTVVLNDTVR
jgi:hypothetical protein